MILEVESSRRRGHVITIIHNFTLINLTFTITSYQVWLPFGALGPLFDLRTWLLLTLCAWSLTVYATELTRHLCRMFRSGIIYRLFTCQDMRLDHLRALFDSKEQPVGWTQPDLFFCAVVILIISIGQSILTRWWRSDASKTWLDGTILWGLPETIKPNIYTRLKLFWKQLRAWQGWTAFEPQIKTRQSWTVLTTQQGWTALRPR